MNTFSTSYSIDIFTFLLYCNHYYLNSILDCIETRSILPFPKIEMNFNTFIFFVLGLTVAASYQITTTAADQKQVIAFSIPIPGGFGTSDGNLTVEITSNSVLYITAETKLHSTIRLHRSFDFGSGLGTNLYTTNQTPKIMAAKSEITNTDSSTTLPIQFPIPGTNNNGTGNITITVSTAGTFKLKTLVEAGPSTVDYSNSIAYENNFNTGNTEDREGQPCQVNSQCPDLVDKDCKCLLETCSCVLARIDNVSPNVLCNSRSNLNNIIGRDRCHN
jgi:hypothetical protein